MNKAIVIFSGGQDSTTCLLWAEKKWPSVAAICFDYGQRHHVEVVQAGDICAQLGIPIKVVDAEVLKRVSSGALLNESEDINEIKNGLPASFVPNRNALFLTLAHAYAQTIGAESIVTGVCQTDYSGYPDCRRDFIDAMEKALNLGAFGIANLGKHIKIHTPLMHLTKAQTFKFANDIGMLDAKTTALDFVLEHSHTCYEGIREEKHPWGYGCGECPACKLREKGWEEFKQKFQ